ncbi:hypothetical protein ABZ478_19920 [Streptomyces sp. NPDC005706]|uniref:hypothetical protein n=1 Tax=Streptomyces sp. NPDC005706 TaxID=3157169 RepID=UPI0033DF0F02
MKAPTLLRILLGRRECLRFSAFDVQFSRAAERAARELGNVRLASVTASQVTFKRWLSGEQMPRGDAATVLEFMLGVSVEALLQPAPVRDVVLPRRPHDASLAAVGALDSAYDTSSLCPSDPGPGAGGVWYLDGLRLYDGALVPVQVYDVCPQGDLAVVYAQDHPHVQAFTGARRRALLLGASGAFSGDRGVFALDSARARRLLSLGMGTLAIPTEYRVDDLTYGLVWAMANIDGSLLEDGHVLHVEQEALTSHLARDRSAIARAAVPGLSRVGEMWLGSFVCASLMTRELSAATEPLLSWGREQHGEEAAVWLFFRHQHALLRVMAGSGAFSTTGAPGRALCVPEESVKISEPYERILLLLTVALMEMHGITVWVCSDPAYGKVDGVALCGQRAVVADWLRAEAVWRVETIEDRAVARTYAEAIGHARADSVVDGPTPTLRLRALADYLGLDWDWLQSRCREVGGCGTSGLLGPRSPLVAVDELDSVLRFIGGQGRG